MATVNDLEVRVSALEALLPTLATKKDLGNAVAEVDKSLQSRLYTVKGEIIGKVDANHKAVMASLESISKSVGRDPNY